MRYAAIILLSASLAFSIEASRASAEVDCCDHCGCDHACQKVCRLVCEEKKVEIICWGCKCEDFCLPTHGKRGCKHCTTVCADCDECAKPDGVHSEPKRFVWWDWAPNCAKMFTKKKLMQKKETKTLPSYKWVVEDLCSGCEASCQCADVVAGAEIPAPPAIADARIIPASAAVARR